MLSPSANPAATSMESSQCCPFRPTPRMAVRHRLDALCWGPLALTRVWEPGPGGKPHHPLATIVAAWQSRPRNARRRRLLAVEEAKPAERTEPLVTTRVPALVSLAACPVSEIDAVEVDGDPFVTHHPDCTNGRRYLIAEPQGELFPAPRTLADHVTSGAMLDALADLKLDGDERSASRADIFRLGVLAFALTAPLLLTDRQGAVLVAGRNSPANRLRFNTALWGLRCMRIHLPGSSLPWALADAEPGPTSRLGPARWMLGQGGPIAWRPTGALFRRATRWGGVERTISGFEGALAWGSSAGRGKGGRLPDALRPVRPGGPGPTVHVPWWQVLRLAGEKRGPDC